MHVLVLGFLAPRMLTKTNDFCWDISSLLRKSCTKIGKMSCGTKFGNTLACDLQTRAGGMIRTRKQQLNSQGYPRNWFIHNKRKVQNWHVGARIRVRFVFKMLQNGLLR